VRRLATDTAVGVNAGTFTDCWVAGFPELIPSGSSGFQGRHPRSETGRHRRPQTRVATGAGTINASPPVARRVGARIIGATLIGMQSPGLSATTSTVRHMADLDNPATRLQQFVGFIRSRPNGGEAIGIPVGEYLGADYPNEMDKLLRSVAGIYSLPDQIRSEVAQLGLDDPAPLTKRLNEIEIALGHMYLNNNVEDFRNRISDAAMDNLDTCASFLRQFRRQPTLSEEQRETIKDEVSNLVADVLDATDLDPVLRGLLLDHLYEMLWAIDSYTVSGVAPIMSAAERIVGAVFVDYAGDQRLPKTSFGKRFANVASAVLLTLNLISTPLAIIAAVDPDVLPKVSTAEPHGDAIHGTPMESGQAEGPDPLEGSGP
jgi:hypothetical protein